MADTHTHTNVRARHAFTCYPLSIPIMCAHTHNFNAFFLRPIELTQTMCQWMHGEFSSKKKETLIFLVGKTASIQEWREKSNHWSKVERIEKNFVNFNERPKQTKCYSFSIQYFLAFFTFSYFIVQHAIKSEKGFLFSSRKNN